MTARTELLTYADGGVVIRKSHGTDEDAEQLADSEVLGAAVLGAVGLRAPEVHKSGPGEVLMEFIPGTVGAELLPDDMPFETAPPEVIESPEGRLLGLADLLIASMDRNSGGWIMDDSGRLTGIDNGASLVSEGPSTSAFARYLLDGGQPPGDMASLRQRLQALQPLFGQFGRDDWFAAMMRREAALGRIG